MGPPPRTTDRVATLWERVLADIRRRMDDGEFAERFPGDAELVQHYGVSRHTIREAVRSLQAEGLLQRVRGRGSFVTKGAIEQPLGALYSLYRSVEATGAQQRSVVRRLEERRDDKAEAMLGCLGQPLIYLERLRLSDGEPIALDCSWLPAALARPLLDINFEHTALYEELAGRCDVRLDSGWERIRPVLPDRVQRSLLCVDSRQTAFAIERLAFSGPTPVDWRHSVVRGDLFSFVARWAERTVDTGFEDARGSF